MCPAIEGLSGIALPCGNQRQLEHDFVVVPCADPNQIMLSFAGANGMRVDAANAN